MIENRNHLLRRVVNRLHEISPFFQCTKKFSLPLKMRRLKKRLAKIQLPPAVPPLEADPLFSSVEIETINRCNGSCSFCPVNHRQDPRPFKKMSAELFRKIIDELAAMNFSRHVCLFSNNEPLLDTRIYEFAEYARSRLPLAHISMYSNGILLDVEKYARIIKNLDSLVIDNYCTDYTMKPNIAEIAKYAESRHEEWKKTNIQIRYENQIMTTRGGQAPNSRKRIKKPLNIGCILPATQFIIRPDGKSSLCCNDALGTVTLGDVNAEGLVNAWNSAAARDARRNVLRARTHFEICKGCDTL